MTERLRASDYRFIAICVLLLTITTWFSARNFHRAFPEGVDRFQSREPRRRPKVLAVSKFLSAQGYRNRRAIARRRSSAFIDEQAKTFLEREAGLELPPNQLMGTRVPIKKWRWAYRWFRPLQRKSSLSILPRAGSCRPRPRDPRRRAATRRHFGASPCPRREFFAHSRKPRPRHARVRGRT